jgi:ribonuclease HI
MKVYYADGGCLNNGTPDFYAYGSYCAEGMKPRKISFRFDEASTNNQAEYMALVKLLEELQTDKEMCEIRMDSQLVVNQVNNLWKVKDRNLRLLYHRARQLINARGKVVLKWFRREVIESAVGH